MATSLMLTVECISQLSDLCTLVPEWSSFLDQMEHVTPFQTPQWLLTWWSHFGSGQLYVLLFREQAKLVGIIPCFLHTWTGRRQLTLLGSGISDYPDPVLNPDSAEEILLLLQEYLESDPNWEICNWQDLSQATPFRKLKPAPKTNIVFSQEGICSRIPLTGTFEDFWRCRSKDLQRNIRRYREKALQIGPLKFEAAEGADNELISALIHLHSARWQTRGETGMIRTNHSAEFLKDIARQFSQSGILLVFGLRFQEEIVAVLLNFRYRNTIFSYLSAFDPQYEILGFGRALLYEAIQYAFKNGYEYWDFLRGNEPYKASWGAQPTPQYRLILTRE